MAEGLRDNDRRERVRREEDALTLEDFVRKEDLLACVKKEELQDIIKEAVREALSSYQHECIMDLKAEDAACVRDLIGAIKEVGDGDLPKAIVCVRENHKFIKSLHGAALKIGWGVIIAVISIMGSLGMLVVGMWRQGGNGG